MTEVTTQELLKSLEEFPKLFQNMQQSILAKRSKIDHYRAEIAAEYAAISDIERSMDAVRDAYVSAAHQLASRFSEAVKVSQSHDVKGASNYVTAEELGKTL